MGLDPAPQPVALGHAVGQVGEPGRRGRPMTWQAPSRAMWRMLATQGSWVARVGATQMSIPWA